MLVFAQVFVIYLSVGMNSMALCLLSKYSSTEPCASFYRSWLGPTEEESLEEPSQI